MQAAVAVTSLAGRTITAESSTLATVMERLRQLPDAAPLAIDQRFVIVHRESGSTTEVTRVRVRGAAGPTDLFVKKFRMVCRGPDESARLERYFQAECERCAQACAALADEPSLRAPRIVASFPDLLVVVSAAEKGESFEGVLRRALLFGREPILRRVVVALGRVGQWVRRFQAGVPLRNPEQPGGREYIDERLRGLVERGHGWFSEPDRSALLDVFDELILATAPDDFAGVAIHADLCPANILLRDDGISVLDFQMSRDGNRMLDLAHLDFHLYQTAARWRVAADVRARLERALLDGYDAGLNVDDALFKLMALQHKVCWLASMAAWPEGRTVLLRPLLRQRVANVVESARRLLDTGHIESAVGKTSSRLHKMRN